MLLSATISPLLVVLFKTAEYFLHFKKIDHVLLINEADRGVLLSATLSLLVVVF